MSNQDKVRNQIGTGRLVLKKTGFFFCVGE